MLLIRSNACYGTSANEARGTVYCKSQLPGMVSGNNWMKGADPEMHLIYEEQNHLLE